MRSYQVGCYVITRGDKAWHWWLRHERFGGVPVTFFAVKFKTLRAAADWAEVN